MEVGSEGSDPGLDPPSIEAIIMVDGKGEGQEQRDEETTSQEG